MNEELLIASLGLISGASFLYLMWNNFFEDEIKKEWKIILDPHYHDKKKLKSAVYTTLKDSTTKLGYLLRKNFESFFNQIYYLSLNLDLNPIIPFSTFYAETLYKYSVSNDYGALGLGQLRSIAFLDLYYKDRRFWQKIASNIRHYTNNYLLFQNTRNFYSDFKRLGKLLSFYNLSNETYYQIILNLTLASLRYMKDVITVLKRLKNKIDQTRLCPFICYLYGYHDGITKLINFDFGQILKFKSKYKGYIKKFYNFANKCGVKVNVGKCL